MERDVYQLDLKVKNELLTRGATPDGVNCITRMLDPFHDRIIPRVGYCDSVKATTAIREYTLQKVLSVPSGVSGNWDCHLCIQPVLYGDVNTISNTSAIFFETGYGTAIAGTGYSVTGNRPMGVSWNSVLNGDPTYYPGTFSTTDMGGLIPNLAVSASHGVTRKLRLVCTGFEVIDRTAEIYKQGAVTVYSVPNDWENSTWTYKTVTAVTNQQHRVDATNTINSLAYTAIHTAPPQTLEQAKLVPNSRTWAASEGVYVPGRLSGMDNPVRSMVPVNTMGVSYGPYNYASDGTYNAIISAGAFTAGGASQATVLNNFELTGAYFHGLAESASLELTAKFVIEEFIGGEQTITTVAQKSPKFDPIALDHYFQIIDTLPVGVPSGYNASGKWWKNVGRALLTAYDQVAPIVSSLPLPPKARLAAEVAKTAVETGREISKVVNSNKRAKSKAKRVERGDKPPSRTSESKRETA